MIFKKIAQTILLLFVCNISNADSLSIFGGKSMDSNLIDFPKKAADDAKLQRKKQNLDDLSDFLAKKYQKRA